MPRSLIFLFLLLYPCLALAGFTNPLGKDVTLGGIFARTINAFLAGAAIFALGAIVFAGFTYATSLGDESKVGKAKKILLYAVIGLIVIILSRAILVLVGNILGVK
ncbi:MAG: hypothetical protein AAB538_05080 [Patescibacteria group bacterium]